MSTDRIVALVACSFLLASPAVRASDAELDPVLRILVKKGVLTLDEAMGVHKEANEAKKTQTTKVVEEVKKASDTSTKFEMGKGVTFSKGDANLTITGRVQVRYDAADEDADAIANVFGSAREGAEETFDVRRARVSFQGAFNKNLDYRLQADFSGTTTQVRYAEIGWHIKNGAFGVNGGQFKVPFGREQLNSSGDLQFVDRSIVDAFFHPAFDRGLMLHGRTPDKGFFHYAAGIFNTEGDANRNTDGDFRTVARIGFDPFGTYRPVQGGFDRPKDPKLAFAVQGLHDDLRDATGYRDSFGFDFAFAWHWFTLDGEWVTTSHDLEDSDEFEADGWRAQVGFMLYKDMVELTARVADIQADYPDGSSFEGSGPDYYAGRGFRALGTTMDDGMGVLDGAIYDDLTAYTLGLNFYFHGHANKLQVDYTWVDEHGFGADARDLDNDIFRVQHQVKF